MGRVGPLVITWTKAGKLAMVLLAAFALTACQGGTFPFGSKPAPGPQPTAPIAMPSQTLPPPGMPVRPDPAGLFTPPNFTGEPIRIGLLLPLSHPNSEVRSVAQALLDAAQLAAFETGNRQLLIMPRDTKGTPDGAIAAATEVLNEGAEVVLGPLFAQTVGAAATVTRGRNIPMIAFSSDRAVAGPGIYLLSFQPEEEVRRVVQYARSQGRMSYAALVPQTAYGTRIESSFRQAVAENAGFVAAVQSYPANQTGMLDPVAALAQSQFDAVLLPESGVGLSGLAPLLPYNNIDPRQVKFLGTGLWDDPSVLKEPSVVGGWFAAPDPVTRRSFADRFQASYGYQPPRIASLSYDAVSLINSYSAGRPFERFLLTTFADPNGFAGVDGIFRFRNNGTIERGLAVVEVTGSGFTVVSPAPTTFQPSTLSGL
ncbi:MAG: ABC transporter substrate-binding protein [Alphaproteobacteria bacterium]|nr:ABC transporter substrate-binding protein [Alphaproteobacteria bacterium]